MRKNVTLVVLFMAVVCLPADSPAEPLTLSGASFLSLDFEGDWFHFVGSTFDLSSRRDFSDPSIPTTFYGDSCLPCRPGLDTVDLSFRTPGAVLLGTGEGTIGGTTYPALTFRGSLDFAVSPMLFPDVTDFTLFLEPSFVFDGFVRAFVGDVEVFAAPLRGRGMANIGFVRELDSGSYVPMEDAIRFDFTSDPAPVPEPSTLLLFATGAVMGGRVWRRRRTAAEPPVPSRPPSL